MHNRDADVPPSESLGVVVLDSVFPQFIFSKAFDYYLFFDADIGSSEALISTLKKAASVCLAKGFYVDVFAASSQVFLGRLDANLDWVAPVSEFNKALRNVGDCDGLIFADETRKWVVYQKRPVDIGVFAFNGAEGFPGLEAAIDESFFNCNDIANWLRGASARDVDLANGFGRDYLAELMKNYCRFGVGV